MQIYYPLIGTTPERDVRIAEFLYERSVDQNIEIWKYHAQAFIFKDFFILETGIAPDGLAGFFLYAASQLRECLNLIKRVTS